MSYKRVGFANPIVLILSLCLVLACAAGVFADVKLPAVISDNMVLQQGRRVPIWGWADNPVCNLSGSQRTLGTKGLPASPFRTDDWPGTTVSKK